MIDGQGIPWWPFADVKSEKGKTTLRFAAKALAAGEESAH